MLVSRTVSFGALAALLISAGCGQTVQPLPDDGFIDVPGGRVAFRVIGGGEGVPLLAIHGGPGGSSCTFPTTLDGVASERPVVMYDQLGSGHSDRISDLNALARLPRFVQEVDAVRKELKLEEVHLLGQSWGAVISLEYLLTTEAVGVKSVVLVGPLVSTQRWLQDTDALVRTLPTEHQLAIRRAAETRNYSTPEFKAANARFIEEFVLRTPRKALKLPACAASPPGDSGLYEFLWGPSEFVATGTLRDYNRVDRLPDIKIPTLFLVGEFDEARPATMRDFQRLMPGSSVVVIPGAGHASNIDAPESFNDAVSRFLAAVGDP